MEQTEKMDRLEGLIKKYGPHSCGIYDLRNVDGDIEWLISEIERLRKDLKKYGGHISIIENGTDIGLCKYLIHSENQCTCGYEQALKEQ